MISPSRRPSAGVVRDGLVKVRVEVRAERVDGAHPALAQDVVELTVNQLDPAAV